MLIDFLVISIIIGILRGGSLKNLSAIPIKNLELIFVSFIIRYLPLVLKGDLYNIAARYNFIISSASYLLLIYALFSNRHIKAMRLVTVGVVLNFIAIVANGGKMPVSIQALDMTGLNELKPLLFDPSYLYHKAIDSATKLSFLGDIFPLPPPYPRPRVFSLGDLMMGIGVFSIVQRAMLKKSEAGGKII
ncbi:MAG: DUF5317 domain-containing protein [Tepidanaerobacteraceae bacterium]|jgi:hypothetical protein|nr:DUF5317 domain-containing protein [Tepidanaerobacteraceae bacterium]